MKFSLQLFAILIFTSKVTSFTFSCNFTPITFQMYTIHNKCSATSFNVLSLLNILTGVTFNKPTNVTVQEIDILSLKNVIALYLPTNMQPYFPNLAQLDVINTGLIALTVGNMKMFPNIKNLYITNNPLQILPRGVFDSNPLLQFASLSGNQLLVIGLNVFSSLPRLVSLDLTNNLCINDDSFAASSMNPFLSVISLLC